MYDYHKAKNMDLMTNRHQRVRIKDVSSPYLPITVGVPQGTLAGPMFWLAFIYSNNPPQSQCMYADDITCTMLVSCSIDDNIQPVVEWGISWNTEHKMALTHDKTKAMLIKFSPTISVPTVFPRFLSLVLNF